MQFIKWAAGIIFGGFAFIMVVGSMLPETNASRARNACYDLKATAATAFEKARAEDTCALMKRQADIDDGRLVRRTN